jgi:hypothetical protein
MIAEDEGGFGRFLCTSATAESANLDGHACTLDGAFCVVFFTNQLVLCGTSLNWFYGKCFSRLVLE